MSLINSYFEGFPIEFKEINPEDFPLFHIENNNAKIIIEPDSHGYINDAFQAEVELRHKNTVVVNAAVGQGKSTAIIKTIKRYYNEHPDTMIIVASPFVSLVEQYCNDIHTIAEIPEEQIFNYGTLGRDLTVDYRVKKIQVVTVNTLLGNPGEDAFKNSDIKRKYLNDLIKHCQDNSIKVVFIYDEIHDAVQNFTEEYIFSLWKWRNVILKNYILSATFSEASKVVIKYLAELTDKKIQIIESKRIVNPDRQSKLYLHYSPAHQFKENTPEIVSVIKKLINANKNIDILSYSKSLAESIINDNEGIGKFLRDKFGELNNCTSELVANQRTENEAPKNTYDNSKCNIGTNFKTGVSIKKRNHAYVIILPPRVTRLWYRNKSGIFSGGINSIIQALARQRTQGEIHIILPLPDKFNYASLVESGMTEVQNQVFQRFYNNIHYHHTESGKEVNYAPLHYQDYLTLRFYKEKLHYNVHNEIAHIDAVETLREGLPSLKYPDYETFKLRNGEDYLANSYKFFGEDIAAYVTYCAFTNQFVNCKLQGISYKTTLFFEEERIQEKLNYYFQRYFGLDYVDGHMSYLNFKKAYESFRSELFGSYILKFKTQDSENWKTIIPYKNKKFEIQLIRFICNQYFGQSYYRAEEFTSGYSDIPYTRGMYFLDSISIVKNPVHQTPDYLEGNNLFRIFQIIEHFRNKIINSIQTYRTNSVHYQYIMRTVDEEFFNLDDVRLFGELQQLIEHDPLLHNNIFEFKNRLTLKTLYKKLCNDFFIIQQNRLPSRNREYIYIIDEIISVPEYELIVDLVSPPKYYGIDLLENELLLLEIFGSRENYLQYQEEINGLLDNSTPSI